ncbi:MAG: hypothetical protein FWC06_06420 [Treponema sp.]|nr:hypothetical protein [Treponema sp.]
MKKIVIFMVLAALVAGGAFAQISLGVGALFDMSFGNGMKLDKYVENANNTSFGGFVFLDANYVEVDVSFAYGSLKMSGKKADGTNMVFTGNEANAGSVLQLGFSVLGKYPIHMGSFTVFPLIGASYNMVLSQKDKDGKKVEKFYDLKNLKESTALAELSQFSILGGVGIDVPFSGNLFFRAEALFNFRLASKSMRDVVDIGKVIDSRVSTTMGMGPRIKVGIGFRL